MKSIKMLILVSILVICSGCKEADKKAAIKNIIDNCPGEVTLTVTVGTFWTSVEAKCVGWNVDQATEGI